MSPRLSRMTQAALLHMRIAPMPALFILFALPVLLWFALAVPMGEVADEPAHAMRAFSLLQGEWIGHRAPLAEVDGTLMDNSGVSGNWNLVQSSISFDGSVPLTQRQMTMALLTQQLGYDWTPTPMFMVSPNTSVYPPFFYIPGAIGIGVAKLLGARPFISLVAGRLANALVYLVVGTMAVVLARGIRPLVLAVLLLPMSLALGASLNQDGQLIAATALAVALLSHTPEKPGWCYWVGGVLLSAVIAAKPVYIPLSAVMLVAGLPYWHALRARIHASLPTKDFARTRIGGFLLASVPAVIWYLLGRHIAAVPFIVRPPYPAGPLWTGAPGQIFATTDPAANLQVLLHRPSLLLTLPWDTLRDEGIWKLYESIGIFGRLDILMPNDVYNLWFAALGLSIVACILMPPRTASTDMVEAPKQGSAITILVMLLAVLATVWLTYIGQYLSWTHVGETRISGVQGRYFIPILLVAALGLPRLAVPGGLFLGRLASIPTLAAGLLGIALLPGVIMLAYYIR
jgi:hypothetical protein